MSATGGRDDSTYVWEGIRSKLMTRSLVLCGFICLVGLCVRGQELPRIPVGNSWMSRLPGTAWVSDLSIPGTHNSGALYEPIAGTAACQSMTISDQLESGVRFFDIRCRHEDDRFTIYHGPVFQKQSYDDVENVMRDFLKKHDKEVLLVTLKQENSPRKISKPFDETVRQYIKNAGGLYFTEGHLPQLKEVRGKIVLLRRFPTKPALGIDATNWGHSGSYQARQLFIQDRFELPSASAKWSLVKDALHQVKKIDDERILHLNFTSGYVKNVLGLPNIKVISDAINPQLLETLWQSNQQRLGCVVVDFMTPELSEAIYRQNFKLEK